MTTMSWRNIQWQALVKGVGYIWYRSAENILTS